jgi:hypothetical protein
MVISEPPIGLNAREHRVTKFRDERRPGAVLRPRVPRSAPGLVILLIYRLVQRYVEPAYYKHRSVHVYSGVPLYGRQVHHL